MSRKPTIKERIVGAKNFFVDMMKAFVLLDNNTALFDWHMMWITLQGKFEVVDDTEIEVEE